MSTGVAEALSMMDRFEGLDWWTALTHPDPALWARWFAAHASEISDATRFRDETGATPLHWACLLKNPVAVENLLEAGASVWALDQEGNYPLRLAMNHGLSIDWDWTTWVKVYPKAFGWEGTLHPARHAIGHHLFASARMEKWTEVKTILSLVPIEACPHLVWSAKEERAFGPKRVFSALGPMPWVHGAILLESATFLDLISTWGADLFSPWHGNSPARMSLLLTRGGFDKNLKQAATTRCWSFLGPALLQGQTTH